VIQKLITLKQLKIKLHTLLQSTEWQSTRPQVISLELVRVYVRVRVRTRFSVRISRGVIWRGGGR